MKKIAAAAGTSHHAAADQHARECHAQPAASVSAGDRARQRQRTAPGIRRPFRHRRCDLRVLGQGHARPVRLRILLRRSWTDLHRPADSVEQRSLAGLGAMSLRETCRRFAPDISPRPRSRWMRSYPGGSRKAEVCMRLNQESLGTARGIIMAVVGVLILVAFLVSRLHLLGFVGR